MSNQIKMIERKVIIKVIASIFQLLLLISLFFNISCEQKSIPQDPIVQENNEQSIIIYSQYLCGFVCVSIPILSGMSF